MSNDVFDFRSRTRLPDDTSMMLAHWQNSAKEPIELAWGRCMPAPVRLQPEVPVPFPGTSFRMLDESSISYRLNIAGLTEPTLVLIHRPLALAMVGTVLGDTPEGLPEDRQLTPIETACLDYLINDFQSSLQATQAVEDPRDFQLVGRVQPNELYAFFPENAASTNVGFTVQLDCGQEAIRWLLPQSATLHYVAAHAARSNREGGARRALEKLILNATGELRIKLGAAQIPLARLASLRSGDVIVLEQRLGDPLVGELGGNPLFRGWAGRIAQTQAYQIEELHELASR